MNFAKGALFGMLAGAIVGVMNSDSIMSVIKKGKKEVMKMTKKYM